MIGIFDSGSGGLTVLKEIRTRLPNADMLYFGDIKNAPYGTKSERELILLTKQAITLLQERGAKNIVSACNSVSVALATEAPLENLIEMVEPTVNSFIHSAARILLTATPATVNAGIYQDAFRRAGKEIVAVAIPDLARAIEFGSSDEDIEKSIREAFATIDLSAFDVLILGCTHYPLVMETFQRLFPALQIFDPATAVAEKVEDQMGREEQGSGVTTFLISKDSEPFRSRVAQLTLARESSIEVIP